MAETNNGGSSNIPSNEELIEQIKQSPLAPIFDNPNASDEEILEAFGRAFSSGGGENPFPGGSSIPDNLPYDGNPFAGENFWNIFAGGVDPTKVSDPLTGGNPPTGGSGSPFPSDGSGSPFPTGGSGSPFPTGGSGSPFPTDGSGIPFPTDGSGIPFPTNGSGNFPFA